MTNQELVALGQMWPNGDAEVIESLIEYISLENPDRVIATAGATESFLQALREKYDGWVGAHMFGGPICLKYGVERLDSTFEFAPGWVLYSGPLLDRLPSMSVVATAKLMQESVASGVSGDFQNCSYTLNHRSMDPIRLPGVDIGHLSCDTALGKHHVGFAQLEVLGTEVGASVIPFEK